MQSSKDLTQNQRILFTDNYNNEISSIFNKLPQKHAEKQANRDQRELTQELLSPFPHYIQFYNVFMNLNDKYGPNGDYHTQYEKDADFIRCRYPTIYTRRQKDFTGDFSQLQSSDHIPGDVPQGVYPAAKIKLDDDNESKFFILGEGPFKHTFPVLLDKLEMQNVNVLIAVGPTEENGNEKYFNYMGGAKEISAKEYLESTTNVNDIPATFSEKDLFSIKFYHYVRDEKNFYIMHIPSWKDLDLPKLTETDKHLLAYDAEYGGNKFYHCSAGVGRSVAIIMMYLMYELVCKHNLNLDQAIEKFEFALTAIKSVKPRAGEWWQLLLSIGMAEDLANYMAQELLHKQEKSKIKNQMLERDKVSIQSLHSLSYLNTMTQIPVLTNTEDQQNAFGYK